MRSFARPATKKDVRAFLGLTGYYRRFIPQYATIAACLSDLTKAAAPTKVRWEEKHETAFRTLKKHLTSSPVLNSPDYEKKFYLQTDASERGIGAVLSQQDKEGSDHPIAFFSRKLLPRETRYATVEKECLAIVAALKHFSVYLLGTHFTVLTDHQALQYLATMRNSNGRLSRWVLSLQPFSFDIFHKPGILNDNADGLSDRIGPTYLQLKKKRETSGNSAPDKGLPHPQPTLMLAHAGTNWNNDRMTIIRTCCFEFWMIL
jgi:phospholipid-translocating ATPase